MSRMFYLSIETDNAAFDDAPGKEVARILREVADMVEAKIPTHATAWDINGNAVGTINYDEGGA